MSEMYQLTNKVTLEIEEEPYVMMMKYAHMFSPKECSGTGLATKKVNTDGSVNFTITEVFLPKQHNTGVTTDIAAGEINRINTQLVRDGKDTAQHIIHWHSHVDFGVYESGTDEQNYDEMQTGRFSLSLVVNKKYEVYGSFHLYDPVRIDVSNIEVEVPEIDMDNYDIPEELQKIIMENVDTVQAYEKETIKEYTYIHPVRSSEYYECGLTYDKEMYSILEEAEKAGRITIDYDAENGSIIGYINTEGEYYTLDSVYQAGGNANVGQYDFYKGYDY